jgi:hypothetical protein
LCHMAHVPHPSDASNRVGRLDPSITVIGKWCAVIRERVGEFQSDSTIAHWSLAKKLMKYEPNRLKVEGNRPNGN